MKLSRILMVGLGGFVGAALRYVISTATAKYMGNFPLGTLLVNVAGGFLMGLLMETFSGVWAVSPEARIFLTTGMLGGLTTFSTFSYETISFFAEGSYLIGGLNAGLNLVFSLLACWGGTAVGKLLQLS